MLEIGAKIIGVVLNKIDVRSQNYYYHHQNYKDYYAPAQTNGHDVGSITVVGK